ncbi:MAG: P-loop NTPase [Euryarchaeota archaeon]|nr:P-loop NTPase [Euryarchaeota archaeon]
MTDDPQEKPEQGAGCPSGPPNGSYRPMDDPTLSGTHREQAGTQSLPEDLSDEDRIRTRLVSEVRGIETPHGDLVASEVLTDLGVGDGIVTATVDCSGLASDTADRVGDQLLGRALAIEGVKHCRIQSVRREQAEDGLAPNGAETVIAVGGAKGGTGKSTLTVVLARLLQRAGLDVGIFDADFEAPAISELLGIDDMVTTTATGTPAPALKSGFQVVSLDLVSGDRPMAWRGAMAHDVLADLLSNAAWSDRDVLLVDLPPGVGEVTETVFSRVPVDGAVLVSTPSDVSVRNTTRTAGLADAHDIPVAAIVENMVSGGIRAGERTFEELLETAPGTPEKTKIPFDPAIQRPAAVEFAALDTETECCFNGLAEAVQIHLARVIEDLPTGTVDLSGLPERVRERQAVLEYGAAPDGPRPLVVADDDLPELLESEFDRDFEVTNLESGRRLVKPGGEPA